MSDKHYKTKFNCPECGGDAIDEVLSGVHQYSTVTDLSEGDGIVAADYGAVSHEGGEVSEYRCAHCCTLLKLSPASKVENEAELLQWLQERGMVEEV
jgi:hypothetical protein